MALSEARKRANQKYIDSLEEIKVRVSKGRKSEIRTHAEQHGESLNGFINRAIEETIQRDNTKGRLADEKRNSSGKIQGK